MKLRSLSIVLIAVLISLPAFALSINIDPPSIKVTMKPGETKNGDIRVRNLGSGNIRVSAYTEDWIYTDDGSKNFMKSGSSAYSCSGWIKLDTVSFELAPMEDKNVGYKIISPGNASGGHVSVIFFENAPLNKEGISVSGRIGTIVFQDTEGDIKRSGEIKEVSATTTTEGFPPVLKIVFSNNGNTYISAKPKISVLKDNNNVMNVQMRPIGTLPGDIRTSTVVLEPLKEGKYKAQIELNYDDKTLRSQTEFVINK